MPFFFVRVDRPATSPNGTVLPNCNLPVSAVAAPCGTCTARSKHQAAFCANWPKHRTACDTCAWPAKSQSPVAPGARPCAVLPSGWAARSPMRKNWSMLMIWTWTSWSGARTSAGCSTRSSEISETWTSPSTPFSGVSPAVGRVFADGAPGGGHRSRRRHCSWHCPRRRRHHRWERLLDT